MCLTIPREGTAKTEPSARPVAEPREAIPALAVLQALKQDCSRLVKDGIKVLCERWNGLPPVRHTLLRTGHGLLGELQDWIAPLTDRFRSLAARTCVWYADVRQVTDGPSPAANPALDRIRQALSQGGAPDHNDRNPEPPFDNRTLAAAMVGLGDQFNAMHGLLIELNQKVDSHSGELSDLGRRMHGLDREFNSIGGKVSNLRGRRLENLAIRAIDDWAVRFSQTREPPIAEPYIELLWTDRKPDRESNDEWRKLCIELGIQPSGNQELRRCDFLMRADWPATTKRERRVILFVGEASTDLDHDRQDKVAAQYAILNSAGKDHIVVPVLFGLDEHRTVIDLPNLVDVRIERQEFLQAGHDRNFERFRTGNELNAVLEPLLAQGSARRAHNQSTPRYSSAK